MSRLYASRPRSATPAFDNVSSDISRRTAIVGAAGNLKSYLPPTATRPDVSDAQSKMDFSSVPATSMGSVEPTNAEREASAKNSTRDNIFVSGDRNVKGISGSGSGKVITTYTPEANDKSTKIVFIQVMREILDGVPAKPSESDVDFSYQDADTTSDFHHVDYVAGEKDPYYNGDDAKDFGPQGNALTKTPASTDDTPHYSDGAFPDGKSTLLYEFRTAAFSAAGADAGTYYGYSDWTYSKEKGKPEATATTGTGSGEPGSKFTDAVDLFNSNHGFNMPGGLGAGAIAGIVLGSIVGAAALGVGIAALAGAF
jgi:hypothetical protein